MSLSGDDVRIGTAEREAALAVLAEQFAEGRLSVEEFSERTDAVCAAVVQRDLRPVFSDLPVAFPFVLAPPPAPVAADPAQEAWHRAEMWRRRRRGARVLAAGCLAMIVVSSVHYWRTGDGHGVVPDTPGSRQWLILTGWQWLVVALLMAGLSVLAGRLEQREMWRYR